MRNYDVVPLDRLIQNYDEYELATFLGSTIFGTDRSKILLVPFLLITVLYVQKKKTADPRSSVTKERTVFNE